MRRAQGQLEVEWIYIATTDAAERLQAAFDMLFNPAAASRGAFGRDLTEISPGGNMYHEIASTAGQTSPNFPENSQ